MVERYRPRKIDLHIPSDILEFFGKPPVLKSEDPQAYIKFLNKLAAEVEPTDQIEWLWLKDIADLSWEILRYKIFKVSILETQRDNNAIDKVYSILQDEWEKEEGYRSSHGNPEFEQWAIEEMENREKPELNTDEDSVEAFFDKKDELEIIERFQILAEERRNKVLREIEFRREAMARRLRLASDNAIAAEGQKILTAAE